MVATLFPRTVRRIKHQSKDDAIDLPEFLLFKDCLHIPNLILLGDPGMGKTFTFKQAAEYEDAEYFTVRSFLRKRGKNCQDKTVYLDALDEFRSRSEDGKLVDKLVKVINECACNRIRLSCRAADWLGDTDLGALKDAFIGDQSAVVSLEPLSKEDILWILEEKQYSHAKAFMLEAEKRNVNQLLSNPQTLLMLVEVVAQGDWPENKKELYEKCTDLLLKESNQEHGRLDVGKFQPDELISMAGMICAILLISNVQSISLLESASEDDSPSYRRIDASQSDKILACLTRRVFTHIDNESVSYIHRTIAEFLGAKWLAEEIYKNGLPIKRVLSLIGYEDHPASELRGLYAWLITSLSSGYYYLIDNDPYGVLMYGDAASLAPSGRKKLMESLQLLQERDPWFRANNWSDNPLAALSGKDMIPIFRNILNGSKNGFHLKSVVLGSLYQGFYMPELADDLIECLNMDDLHSEFHEKIILILLKSIDGYEKLFAFYESLDVDDDVFLLKSMILKESYFAKYFGDSDLKKFVLKIGIDYNFKNCMSKEEWIETYNLWMLFIRFEGFSIDEADFHDCVAWFLEKKESNITACDKFVLRLIDIIDGKIDLKRFWFFWSVRFIKYRYQVLNCESIENIGIWLSMDKSLIVKLFDAAFYFKNNYYGLAEILKDLELLIYHCPFNTLFDDDFFKYICNDYLRDYSKLNEDDFTFLYERLGEYFLTSNSYSEELFDSFSVLSRYSDAAKKTFDDISCQLNEKKRRVNKNKVSQSDNIVLANSSSSSCSDKFELLSIADISALLDDCESFDSTIKLLSRRIIDKKWYNILISLSVHIKKQEDLLSFSEKSLQYIFSMIICFPRVCESELVIMDYVSDRYENIAKDVYRKIILSGNPEMALSSIRDDIFMSRSIIINNVEKKRCNRRFPWGADLIIECVREDHSLIRNYNYVIFTYIIFRGGSSECISKFDKLIDDVLTECHTNSSCLVWLVMKFFITEGMFHEELLDFVKNDYNSIWFVIDFLKKWNEQLNLDISLLQKYNLALIIGLHAPLVYRPSNSIEGYNERKNPWDAAEFVMNIIDSLSSKESVDAGDYLKRLLKVDYLSSYDEYIKNAIVQQLSIYRTENYEQQRPSFLQTIKTLKNTYPANIADLYSLIVDHLQNLKKEILDGNTDKYKAFWRCDSYGRTESPEIEEICRDRLIDFLSPKMPIGLHVEPEGHMADDKRADIIVLAGGNMKLPLELKRDMHADVWNACVTQLDRLYTRDPDASGYGIYVVFWFGDKRTTSLATPPDGISKPNSASEMELQLRQLIPDAKRHYLDVIVIDVTSRV